MRVLMVTQFFAPVTGGEERVVEDLSRELSRRGHRVALATLKPSGPGAQAEPGLAVHHIGSTVGRIARLHIDSQRRHVPPAPDPEATLGLRRVIARERPDVIHAHNWLMHSLLPLRARRRVPLVISLHDYGLVCANKRLIRDDAPCSGPELARCVRCASRHFGAGKGVPTALLLPPMSAAARRAADLFIPVSESVAARSGLARRGLPYDVIPNFVPDALVGTPPGPRPAGLPEGRYVVFAGDLSRDKGLETLLRAHAAVRGAPPLVLVGRAVPTTPRRLPAGTIRLGPRPHAELMEIFRGAQAALVPSTWEEPFGLVALEAMAMACPVIASRVGGLPDIIDDGRTGLLVPPGDHDALAGALRRVLGSAELRRRLGAAGALHAGEFSASAVVPRFESAYRRLIDRAGGNGWDGAAPAARFRAAVRR
jgi:glycosyltransferase involved in cell wall biosynthesis